MPPLRATALSTYVEPAGEYARALRSLFCSHRSGRIRRIHPIPAHPSSCPPSRIGEGENQSNQLLWKTLWRQQSLMELETWIRRQISEGRFGSTLIFELVD